MKEGLYDFKGFFEYHPVPSWIYNAAKNEIVELNLAAAKRYDYSREEFQQLVFSNLPSALERLTPSENPEQHFLGQFTHSTKTGEPVFVNLYANQLSSGSPNNTTTL